MDNSEANLILKYVNKNYRLRDGFFYDRSDKLEWIITMTNLLSKIFSISEEYALDIVRTWTQELGMDDEDFHLAFNPALSFAWTIDGHEPTTFGGVSFETEYISLMLEMVEERISINLRKFFYQNKELFTYQSFILFMRCLGYQLTRTFTYDEITGAYKKNFIRLPYNEMMNERHNNTHWKNWLRS